MDLNDPERLARNMVSGMAITAAIIIPVALLFGMFFSCMLCGACGALSRPPGVPMPSRPTTNDTPDRQR